jgi:hypothetical protein
LPGDAHPPIVATPSSSLKPFLIACIVILAIMEGLGVMVTNLPGRSPDFRTFYAAGYLLRTDRAHFYDMEAQTRVENQHVSPARLQLFFNHPAYEAIVDAPFTLLPFKWAYRAFMVFNALLMLLCAATARDAFARAIPFLQPRPGFAMLLFAPLLLALAQGQDSILFLLLVCLCWRETERGNDLTAGLALALALFRFQLAIPLAVIFVFRRGLRFAAGFCAGAVGVVALCFGLVGVSGMRGLLHLIQLTSAASENTAAQATIILPITAMANLRGLLYACGTRFLAPHAAFAIVAIASLAVAIFCVLRLHLLAALDTAFAIAILGAILVSYHLFLHDLTLLILPIVLLAGHVRQWMLLSAYLAPAIVLLFLGTDWYWAAALPVLVLTVAATRAPRPAQTVPVR